MLGQGGFGITYLAVQSGLERKVAIKEFFMREFCNRDGSTSHVTLGTEGSRETLLGSTIPISFVFTISLRKTVYYCPLNRKVVRPTP